MYRKYNFKLKSFSKVLRNEPTRGEKEMWNFLRVNFKEYIFVRQKPLDNFILDFYCSKQKLIIEIDGEVHLTQKEKDKERDDILFYNYGLKTLRFTNDEVFTKRDSIKKILIEALH